MYSVINPCLDDTRIITSSLLLTYALEYFTSLGKVKYYNKYLQQN